jgi:hypothetical protein
MSTSSDPVSRFKQAQIATALQKGYSLAVADQILIAPHPGWLNPLVQELLACILASGAPPAIIDQALLRLGMNFAGRDAEVAGYSPAEAAGAFDAVVHAIAMARQELKDAMPAVVAGFLAEMKSVNLANSMPGLLAERIE